MHTDKINGSNQMHLHFICVNLCPICGSIYSSFIPLLDFPELNLPELHRPALGLQADVAAEVFNVSRLVLQLPVELYRQLSMIGGNLDGVPFPDRMLGFGTDAQPVSIGDVLRIFARWI